MSEPRDLPLPAAARIKPIPISVPFRGGPRDGEEVQFGIMPGAALQPYVKALGRNVTWARGVTLYTYRLELQAIHTVDGGAGLFAVYIYTGTSEVVP